MWQQSGKPAVMFLEVAEAGDVAPDVAFRKIAYNREIRPEKERPPGSETRSEFASEIVFDKPGKYLWRVRAIDDAGFHGRKGEVRYVEVQWNDRVLDLRIRSKKWKK